MAALTVLHLSDIHFQAEPGDLYGRDPDQTLDLVLAEIAGSGRVPDVVVATGDLAHGGAGAGYRRLAGRLASIGAPVYCLAGNHDAARPLEANLPRPGVHLERLVRCGDWLFVLLDSNNGGRGVTETDYVYDLDDRFMSAVIGEVAPADLDWLDAVLYATDAPNVMVWMHHPPLELRRVGGLGGPTPECEPLFEVLRRHPAVRGVGVGHIHSGDEATHAGIRVLAAPSTWLAFDFAAWTFAPPGYRWLTLHDDGCIDSAPQFLRDERFEERRVLPEWVAKVIAGDFDHGAQHGRTQEDVIDSFATGH